MSSSSSSAPMTNKPTNLSPIQQTMFKNPNSSSSSNVKSLIKRQETVFKKAYELSVLCGIEVCVIYYGPDGEFKTWPEEREKVESMARRYSGLSKTKRCKRSVDLHEFLQKINNDDSKKKKEVKRVSKVKYPVWDSKFDDYSVDQLTELCQSLERNRTRIEHRLRVVVESQKQRKIQSENMAKQELMMTTTKNYVQQNPNKVSMYLFNHGNGTLSEILVPTTALNQGQSLPSIPVSLTNYPNWNVGNYSGSLGVQETGINQSQNMNMITYNNNNNTNNVYDLSGPINQNPLLESYNGLLEQNIQNNIMENYSGLLGVQQNGVNELENIQNHQMGSYSGLLGFQQSGVNELGYIQNPLMGTYSGLLGLQPNGINELENITNPTMESCSGLLGLQDFQQNRVNDLEYMLLQ